MSEIKRIEIDELWADSTVIEAGDYIFVGYCMGNEGKSIEEQIHGAIDVLEKRLKMVGLTLECVVKMDMLMISLIQDFITRFTCQTLERLRRRNGRQ